MSKSKWIDRVLIDSLQLIPVHTTHKAFHHPPDRSDSAMSSPCYRLDCLWLGGDGVVFVIPTTTGMATTVWQSDRLSSQPHFCGLDIALLILCSLKLIMRTIQSIVFVCL